MTTNLEHRYAPEIRFVAASSTSTETKASDGKRAGGYAALYNSESGDLGSFVEVLAPGAFTRTLVAIANGEHKAFLFWQHDSRDILASVHSGTLTLTEDERGLAFEFDTDGLDEKQRKALSRGDLQVSFGFRVVKETWEEVEGDIPYRRTIHDLDLFEVSLVTYPAYEATTVAMRSLDAWKETRAEEPVEQPETVEEAVETVDSEPRSDTIRITLKKRWADARIARD